MKNTARSPVTERHHAVRFYENEKSLAQIVAQFLSEGFAAGDPGLVVAVPTQRAAILKELVARSVDVVALQRSDDLLLLDAEETLSSFMKDGKPDAEAFDNNMCAILKRMCGEHPDCTVRIFGQMVDVLWKDGQQAAAISLEMLWNRLANTQAFSLLCGYAMGQFYKDANIQDICRQHTHMVSPDGNLSAVA
jgi:hypothetical protein